MPEDSVGLKEKEVGERLPQKPLTRRAIKRKYQEKAQHAIEDSEVDELTGLPNLKGFKRRLTEEIERYKRTGRVTTVMMFDLDKLKAINDSQGHAAGNEYLIRAAQTLRSGLRLTDYIARVGGDEFAAILPDTNAREVRKIWDERLKPLTLSNRIQISAGADELNPENPDQSLQNADSAMYGAKREPGINTLMVKQPQR